MNPILWTPDESRVRGANLTRFRASLPRPFADYAELHRWSVSDRGEFWRRVWQFAGVRGELGQKSYEPGSDFLDARWFADSRLNYAENLLRDETSPAIVFRNERGEQRTLTHREVRQQASAVASWLTRQGVRPGDRIAAVLPNIPEAIVLMLGSAWVGAIWSSCSPDFGDDAICDRFRQIEPVILFSSLASQYAGKPVPIATRVQRLRPRLPTVQRIVYVSDESFGEVLDSSAEFPTQRFPFNHPLAILYSSGTTGAPKCIVHGAGGTLLQHLKEHQLHCDLKPGDRLFYFTTTGWMMWNWLASGLASGATIVLYDGSPLHPQPDTLWKLAAEDRVTHFGASAKYFAAIEKAGVKPREMYDLSALRCVMSTGSPLLPESFDYIYRDIKPDVNLASISGGTDIISCFALGCPTLPVRRGELQVKGLGMDVKVFNDVGRAIVGEPGELVCASPFPSMPVGFWNDPDGAKYRAAYFERFENIWHHGDWAEETATGGLIIHGRSDATLNPGGVRIGTAEIYAQVEAFPEVAEALAVAFRRDGDEKIVLFLRMKADQSLSSELIDGIKQRLRTHCSPRHVPHFVLAAPEFPRTISGKLSEIAVRNAINGQPIRNTAALANPESLAFFQRIPQFQPSPGQPPATAI